MKKLILILTTILILAFSNVNAQQMSTKGKDFWLGFLNNNNTPNQILSVYIASTQNTSGTISAPGLSWSQNFTILANTATQIYIPLAFNASMHTNGVADNYGIHITAIDSVAVTSSNILSATSDASLIFPTNTLDYEYRILTLPAIIFDINGGPEYLVVATDSNTIVQITPYLGSSYTINLNQGQTYQIASNVNLSGALIKSLNCKKIAVFCGSKCTVVGYCGAADHVYDEMLPVNRFGKNFITVPFLKKTRDFFQILAHYNNTLVSIKGLNSNTTNVSLNAGQTYMDSTGQTTFIQASQPIFVYQYAEGGACESPNYGDPLSVIVPPMEQSINEAVFNVFTPPFPIDNYINIVTPTADTSYLTLDGLQPTFTKVSCDSIYSFARLQIGFGNHHLISPYGFIATVYGFSNNGASGIGYSAGFSLINLQDNYTTTPNLICPGDTVTFTALFPDIAHYKWIFGDGTTDTGAVVKHIYSSINTYNVALISSKINGCSIDTIWKILKIGYTINKTLNPIICQGNHYTVGTHNYTTTGIYVDTLFINQCPDTIITTHLTVKPKYFINLGNDTSLCVGQTIVLIPNIISGTFHWQDGSLNPLYNVIHSGSYWITENNDSLCYYSDTTHVLYYSYPNVNLGNDTILCYGQTITLNATFPNATYLWQDGSTNATFTVAPPYSPYIFSVKVTVNNCTGYDTINLNYIPAPIINFGKDTVLCNGDSILLDVSNPNATYLWQDNTTNPTYNVKQQGIYSVIITMEGCIFKDTIQIVIDPPLFVNLGSDTTVCVGSLVVLDPGNLNTTYQWQDGATGSTYTVSQQGIYWVKVSDINKCSASDTIFISYNDCDTSNIIIPNFITPNNDGYNDLFVIKNTEYKTIEVQIYNRWGVKVFEDNNYQNTWDGKYKGNPLADGTYFYIIKSKGIFNKKDYNYQGSLTILR